MNKAELRRAVIKRNSALENETKRLSDEAIAKKLIALPEYVNANCIFVYIGVGDEVLTDEITENLFAEKKRVCVPFCHGKGIMDAVEISSKEELVPGKYNIPEPRDRTRIVTPKELELVIVPGVAFGEDGSRLGRGGGYYDRFLKNAANAKKIALCREINLEKTVPREEHDEFVDIIVTDKRVIKTER